MRKFSYKIIYFLQKYDEPAFEGNCINSLNDSTLH
jgi:hypothetical protein